ncbi:MAG: hypothetical protein IT453_18075 [Planctomycetes bacterium]|nr:hypothetical protein [Planctomycetota bacterium]
MDALLDLLASVTRWASDDPTVRRKRAWIFALVIAATVAVIAYAVWSGD